MSPHVLSIAGFDPSGGAGVLSDAKTFNAHQCIGLAISTGTTVQNAAEVREVEWSAISQIELQLEALAARHEIAAVKIGLVENSERLREILSLINNHLGSLPIVWDPVCVSSSNFRFHDGWDLTAEELSLFTVITPNEGELGEFSLVADESLSWQEKAEKLSQRTTISVTGILSSQEVTNCVFSEGAQREVFSSPRLPDKNGKHGSGCIFSSVVAASLAKGYTLREGIMVATEYVFSFLAKSEELLGLH